MDISLSFKMSYCLTLPSIQTTPLYHLADLRLPKLVISSSFFFTLFSLFLYMAATTVLHCFLSQENAK